MKKINENTKICLDEAIEKNTNACKVICVVNSRFAQLGIPMLVMSNSRKKMEGRVFGISPDDLALFETFSMREVVQLSELAVRIKERGNYPYPQINVILSGSTRKGMMWVSLMDEIMGLRLKSLPFSALYSGKHYDGKGIFIIVSSLPVAELKRGFPKLYSDVILLEEPPQGV